MHARRTQARLSGHTHRSSAPEVAMIQEKATSVQPQGQLNMNAVITRRSHPLLGEDFSSVNVDINFMLLLFSSVGPHASSANKVHLVLEKIIKLLQD